MSKTVSVIRAEVQLSGVAQIPAEHLLADQLPLQRYRARGPAWSPYGTSPATTRSPTRSKLIGGAGSSEFSSDAGLLTFDGPIFLGNISSRSAIFSGMGNGVVNGQLSNQGTNALTVEKNGPGTWTLTAANVYTGPTLVRAGKLCRSQAAFGGSWW